MKFERWMHALFAFAIVAAIGNLAIWWAGATPATVWFLVLQGTLGNAYGIGETLARATPLALTGVSVAFALRAGLFNLGAEGQLAAGILAAAVVGARIPHGTPRVLAVSLTLIAAAASGALLGALPGWLRGRFGAHEVITSLMLNGLIAVLTTWLYGGPLRVGEQVHTRAVASEARIPMLGGSVTWFRGSALERGAAARDCRSVRRRVLAPVDLRRIAHPRGGQQSRCGAGPRGFRPARVFSRDGHRGSGCRTRGCPVRAWIQGICRRGHGNRRRGFAGIAVAPASLAIDPFTILLAAVLFGALSVGGPSR